MDAARIAELRRQLEVLSREIERLEAMPEDVYELGTVLTWQRTFAEGGKAYTYAAVKFVDGYAVGGHNRGLERWAITGRTSRFLSWESLWENHLSRADEGTVFWASVLEPVDVGP
jgi:hypothetical protein